MTTFILVPGAWHGAWCWERVAPLLDQADHHAVAIDLPGLDKSTTDFASATLENWSRFVAHLALAQSGKVVLVGHSRAGAVISQSAEYAAKQLTALVYVSGMLLADGTSVMGFGAQGGMSAALASALVPAADGSTLSVRPDSIGPVFYNTTADEWRVRAASRLIAEPIAPNNTPLQLTDANFGAVPRFYIECLRDAAIPPPIQQKMYQRLPCQRVISLDTDHSPFYSAPQELAKALLQAA